MPQTKGWFGAKPLKLHGWAPHLAGLYRGTRVHCRTKPNLGRPSGGGETLRKLHRGGARIPEAQVKVLFAGPAVILVGHWIRGGEGLAPNKGMV